MTDWTPDNLTEAALTPCEHRSDVPCAGCEMARRQGLMRRWATEYTKRQERTRECTQLIQTEDVMAQDQDQIGYLVDGAHVVCLDCASTVVNFEPRDGEGQPMHPMNACRLYRVNIGSYKQTCHSCSRLIVEGCTPAWSELFPNLHRMVERQSNPDADEFFYWTIRIGVHARWVGDGIDFTDRRAVDLLRNRFKWLTEDEVKATVLSRPPDEAVAKEQGYDSVAAYVAQRNKGK